MERDCKLKHELSKRDAMMDRLRNMINSKLELKEKDTRWTACAT